jgi:hypothetical protein
MWWTVFAACSPADDPEDRDPGQDPAGSVSCAAQPDNALRVDCAVDLPSEAPARISLTYADPDGEAVTVDVPAAAHAEITLWGLRADTAYAVEVDAGEALSTSFTTGALPEALAGLTVEVTGATSLEAVAQTVMCGGTSYLVVLDPTGAVRWYQPMSDGQPPAGGGGNARLGIGGFSVTDGPGFLALVDEGIREWSVTGAPGLSISGSDHDLLLHHDLIRAGDETLALFAESIAGPDGNDYMIDGVAAFDSAGALIDTWHLADHIDPAQLVAGGGPPNGMGMGEGPDGIDWSHANGITVTEDGDWLVSFRWLSAVYRIGGRRGSPSFGEVEWTVVGDPASPIPSSFVVDAAGAFLGQHHPTLVGDALTVFDNRQRPDDSRAVTLSLDEAQGTASLVEAHGVGETCDVEGAAFPLPGGGVFATCATSGTGLEFPAGSGDAPSFTIHATCEAEPTGTGPSLTGPGSPRIVPFDLP